MADTPLPPPPSGYTAVEALPPPPAGYSAVAEPGILESLGRGAAEGATFGYDDKLGLDRERRELSRKANPWTHFMGEILGGAVPMAAASLIPTGVGQAASAGRVAQLAGRGLELARGALVPGEIATLGQAATQGAKLGAVYGGLSGSGHADVSPDDTSMEALQKRIMGAIKGGATGAVLGAPLGAIGHGVYRGAQTLGGLKAVSEGETAGVGQGALRTATRKLEEDRITPQQLIDQIKLEFPDDTATASGGLARRFWGDISNRQPITAEQVEETVRRAMMGETAADISQALKTANGGNGPGEAAVQTLLDELATRHLGPLNLVDRTSLARTGAGDNTQMAMRAAAATPGEHLGTIRESLLERQIGAGGRLGQLLDRAIGSSDYEGVAAKHAADLASAGQKAYGTAFANEQPFNLSPIFQSWKTQYQNLRGIGDDVKAAIARMEVEVPGAPGVAATRRPPQNLEEFILARETLRDAIEGAKTESPNLARRLTDLYKQMDAEVGASNPDWVKANQLWRDGKAAEDAMDAGARMTTRLNASSRENLAEFTSARSSADAAQKELRAATGAVNKAVKAGGTPTAAQTAAVESAQAKLAAAQARQELFKVGLVRALSDMLSNRGETHNLTRQLLLPGAQKMLREVLGPDADQFFKVLRAEAAMHRTYSSQFGSQTTPLREAIDELNWAPRFEAAWHNLGFGKILQLASEYAARNINNRRNVDLIRNLYTETDPLKQLEALRAMQTLHTARSTMGNAVGRPAIAFGSALVPEAVVAGEAAQKALPPPSGLRPYRP